MPLSNPTSKSECSFEQASNWTKGAVIFGAGSPFPIMTDCNGKRQEPQQSNNFYVFPHIVRVKSAFRLVPRFVTCISLDLL